MTELIRQNYNRPSLMCWGIGNEVQVASIPGGADLMRELSALVKREDPGRYSTLATCFDETGGTYNEDLIAHNRYFGWYTGVFKDLGPWMDAQRAKAPKVPLGISEYGAGAGPSIHTTDPKVMDHSEEYQCLFHEAYWSIMAKRPWLWCKAVWVAFDFASDGRAEGEQLGINDKGLVTRDRKILKDSFFYYKAQWNPEPMVYLTARRWTARTEEKTQVKVYTNCPSVELLQNGVSLGKRKAIGGVAVWDKVELEPGANRMEVSGKKDGRKVTDQCTWILNVYPWNRPKKKT
jgi:beta-galactosidase